MCFVIDRVILTGSVRATGEPGVENGARVRGFATVGLLTRKKSARCARTTGTTFSPSTVHVAKTGSPNPLVVCRRDAHPNARAPQRSVASLPMADDDGLISGLTEEQLITNEEMDGLVKEVRRGWARDPSVRGASRARVFGFGQAMPQPRAPMKTSRLRTSSRRFGSFFLTRVHSRRTRRGVVVPLPRASVPFVSPCRARRRSSKPSARTHSCTRR